MGAASGGEMRRRASSELRGAFSAAPVKVVAARDLRRRPTPAEAALWQRLRGGRLGVRARRQCVLLGWIVDFYVPAVALVVEVDGDVHDLSQADDARRTEALEQVGLLVLRFHNAEVLDAPQRVLAVIRAVIASR